MKLVLKSVFMICFCVTLAEAQDRPDPNIPQGVNFEVPEGWEVRLDHNDEDVVIGSEPDSSDIYFVNMTPGWHITTGPAGIFYHPANTASGNFEIQSEIFFFDPGQRNREGYGLFWGGANLQDEDQEYLYFLLRNTGEFLIKKRMGEDTEVIQGWTPSDAIETFGEGDESSVRNMLKLISDEQGLQFVVNDKVVAEVSAEGFNNEGIYGLRVNHSVNLHISDLSLKSLD